MKSLTDTYTLSNGVKIPVIGFGTWQVEDGRQAVDAVKAALYAGYRHIDTAQGYGNEESVGRAVKDSGVKRDEIFITSKLVNSVRGYKQTKAALDESLGKLGGFINLFLLHWPVPIDFKQNWKEMNAESWRAMEEYFQAGKLHALGVSNFHGRHVDELLKTAKVKPVVNQIRLCPGDTQDEVVAYSRGKGMLLEAYSPLGVGAVLQVPQMQELAAKYGKSVAQVAIRWSLQNGFLPLPKSVTPVRIRENANVFDFELSPDDMRIISALKGVAGVHADPDNITW
jgi:diketogulonate reductase-like aldo/keto reductase